MKNKFIITILCLFITFTIFGQKDSTFKNHLVVKIAPLTLMSLNSAFQIGLETNYNKSNSICLDYAIGGGGDRNDNSVSGFEKIDFTGKKSHRIKLEHRWYLTNSKKRNIKITENPFLDKTFIGVELSNKIVSYSKEVTIGHTERSFADPSDKNNIYDYYELKNIEGKLNEIGIFTKIGKIDRLFKDNKFYVEYYVGFGISLKKNTVKTPDSGVVLEDEIKKPNYDTSTSKFLEYRSGKPYNFNHFDMLLSLKLNYLIN